MNKLVCGVGFNDGSRPAKLAGKNIKEYTVWQSMLIRCYDEDYQVKYPTYKGCYVSDNFLNYSYFYDWCQEQVGFGKQNWQLDKDILVKGNKLYSETTCVFVPREVNLFFTNSYLTKFGLPRGVSYVKSKGLFVSQCCVNGKQVCLGYFSKLDSAFHAYKSFKEARCKEVAMKWESQVDRRVFDAMMNWSV